MADNSSNFGADEHHGVSPLSPLKKLGLGGKQAARDKQSQSNEADYKSFADDSKPVLTYPQDLFKANQVNGVCFFVKVRNNSVAAQSSSAPDGLAADRIGSFQSTHSEMATQMNRSSVEQNATVTRVGGGLLAAGGLGKMGMNFKNKGSFWEKTKSLGGGAGATTAAGLFGLGATEIARNQQEKGFNNEVDYAFLGAWNFKKEIIKKEKNFIKNGGKFITHVTNVKVITKY